MEEKIKNLSDAELIQLYRLLLEYLDVIGAEKEDKAGDNK
jgi:hypothetical protein